MTKSVHKPEDSARPARMPSWEHFPHVADVGIRGSGPTLDSAFEQAAKALTAAVTDPDTVRSETSITITCDAPNPELLLVDWLNAIIYEMATRKMLFGSFNVSIHGNRLGARISGEPIDMERHAPATEVKGATLSELGVSRDRDGWWHTQCVVDV